MRVAIIHYWLVAMRGGENVLESLCRLFPEADIYTHCLRREVLSPTLRRHNIHTTFIDRLPFSRTYYQYYLPLMPLALEQLVLRDYDLVISLESGPSKGVIVPASTPHLCYCFTPMRYLWDFSEEYLQTRPALLRPFMRYFLHRLRLWDVVSSHRVDRYLANSNCVAKRVAHWWGRSSSVVFPPVELPDAGVRIDELTAEERSRAPYVFLGQLVAYKRADLAIQACHLLQRELVVIGDGEERRNLEALARRLGARVTFTGRLPDSASKWEVLRKSRALLFPGEEDFGIVPLEALALGCPVVGYGRGGLLDTVRDGVDGVHFDRATPESLAEAMQRLEQMHFDPHALRARAEEFSEEQFHRRMREEVDAVLRGERSPAC